MTTKSATQNALGKDFPYYRRVWNSVVTALLAAAFLPLLLVGGGLYYYATTVLTQRTLDNLRLQVIHHREVIDAFLDARNRFFPLVWKPAGRRSSFLLHLPRICCSKPRTSIWNFSASAFC